MDAEVKRSELDRLDEEMRALAREGITILDRITNKGSSGALFFIAEEWITMEHCRECEEAKQEVQDIQVRLAVVESKVAKIEENIEKSNTNWLVKAL